MFARSLCSISRNAVRSSVVLPQIPAKAFSTDMKVETGPKKVQRSSSNVTNQPSYKLFDVFRYRPETDRKPQMTRYAVDVNKFIWAARDNTQLWNDGFGCFVPDQEQCRSYFLLPKVIILLVFKALDPAVRVFADLVP